MGRKSTKEDKNIFQISREQAGLTREAAADKLDFISADRIAKIEYETTEPHPEDVLAMAKAYEDNSLCNAYCSQLCPIGREYVPQVEVKTISQITVEMMVILGALSNDKERLMEIVVDGQVTEDEEADFRRIEENLDKMELIIDSLKLWVKNTKK